MPKNPGLRESYLRDAPVVHLADDVKDVFLQHVDYMGWCALNPVCCQKWEFGSITYLPELGLNDESMEKLKCFMETFKFENGEYTKDYGYIGTIIKIENIYKQEINYKFENGFKKCEQTSHVVGFKFDYKMYVKGEAFSDYEKFKLNVIKDQFNSLQTHLVELIGKEEYMEAFYSKKKQITPYKSKNFKSLQRRYNRNVKPDLLKNGVPVFMKWYGIYDKHITEFFDLLYTKFKLNRDDTKVFDILIDIKNIHINTNEKYFMRLTAIDVWNLKRAGKV